MKLVDVYVLFTAQESRVVAASELRDMVRASGYFHSGRVDVSGLEQKLSSLGRGVLLSSVEFAQLADEASCP